MEKAIKLYQFILLVGALPPLEQRGRQGTQTLRQGLLGQILQWWDPEQRFTLGDPDQLVDTADLPPQQSQYQPHHHWQGERPHTQAQRMKIAHLLQSRRMDDLGQAFDHRFRRWGIRGAVLPVALNRTGVTHRTAFSFIPLRICGNRG